MSLPSTSFRLKYVDGFVPKSRLGNPRPNNCGNMTFYHCMSEAVRRNALCSQVERPVQSPRIPTTPRTNMAPQVRARGWTPVMSPWKRRCTKNMQNHLWAEHKAYVKHE